MELHEGRLAGLGLTPSDDETETNVERMDLGMLLTLTPDNYGEPQVFLFGRVHLFPSASPLAFIPFL